MSRPPPNRLARMLWRGVGLFALGFGAIGIVLPLVPTTPFLLVAVWCFERGSPEWRAWLLAQPQFGPRIERWRAHGIIDRHTKHLAIAVMLAAVAGSAVFGAPIWVLGGQAVVMAGVAVFLLTRPETPPAHS